MWLLGNCLKIMTSSSSQLSTSNFVALLNCVAVKSETALKYYIYKHIQRGFNMLLSFLTTNFHNQTSLLTWVTNEQCKQ